MNRQRTDDSSLIIRTSRRSRVSDSAHLYSPEPNTGWEARARGERLDLDPQSAAGIRAAREVVS